ncbi:hypothetical protein Tco_1394449 [Tanacetum coccineum]
MVKFCNRSDDYLELGVAGEWLCVVHHYCESPVVDVWVMKVYGVKDSWTKLASIPYPDHWWGVIWDPLCISKDGKLLLQFGLQLHIYDSKDSSSLVIEIKCYDACIVVESLVSPFPPLGLADNNGDEDQGESCSSNVVSFSEEGGFSGVFLHIWMQLKKSSREERSLNFDPILLATTTFLKRGGLYPKFFQKSLSDWELTSLWLHSDSRESSGKLSICTMSDRDPEFVDILESSESQSSPFEDPSFWMYASLIDLNWPKAYSTS